VGGPGAALLATSKKPKSSKMRPGTTTTARYVELRIRPMRLMHYLGISVLETGASNIQEGLEPISRRSLSRCRLRSSRSGHVDSCFNVA
jgi:hypothetical protein